MLDSGSFSGLPCASKVDVSDTGRSLQTRLEGCAMAAIEVPYLRSCDLLYGLHHADDDLSALKVAQQGTSRYALYCARLAGGKERRRGNMNHSWATD
jgi:hypothetical protein